MVDTTWTNGGGDGKASTAANRSNGIDVGYNVIFDGTSTANCAFDYDGQLGTFVIAKGTMQLLSNITISNLYAHINPLIQGAFTLTKTKPENEYTSIRRPFIRTIKKLDIGAVGLAEAWLEDVGAVI